MPGQGNNAGKSLVRKNAACLRNLEEADVVVAEEIRGEWSAIHWAEFEKLRSASNLSHVQGIGFYCK